MPRYIGIHSVGIWLDEVADQEDADFASSEASSLEGDDLHTHTTLEEVLEKLTRDVAGLRVAVGFQTEEGDEDVLAYAHGEPWDEGQPEDAPSTDTRLGTRSVASGYARYLEASTEATEAVAADDIGVMLRLLDDPRLAAPLFSETRHPRFRLQQLDGTRLRVWRAIVAKPRDLPLDRVLRAFAEEADEVAHIIAYKLYVQKHLQEPLAARMPADDARVERWVAQAIADWPDFPRRAGPAPAPAPKKRRTLLEQLDVVLPTLENDEVKGLDSLRRKLEPPTIDEASLAEARAHAGPRLVAMLATSKPERVRAIAVELLWAMNVSASELVPCIAGLSPSPTLDAIRAAAAPPSELPPPLAITPEAEAVPIVGVICDVTKVEDRAEAAMALAECSGLPTARRGTINWLAAMAEAFPDATIEYAEEGDRVYTARGGRIDWDGNRSSADAIAAGDLRKQRQSSRDLPDAYVALAASRAALERGIEEADAPEKLWALLADPVLSPKSGPLRKLGQAARIEAYERLALAPRPVPTALALDAIMREPQIGFRLVGALRSRWDLQDAFGAVLREARSPLLREKLREILGHAAERYEKRALPAVPPRAPEPISISIPHAIDDALARAEVTTLGAATPKRFSRSEKAAFDEAQAAASEADKHGELTALLAALELPALAGDRGDKVRASLWKGVLSTRRPTLALARVLRALAEEVDEVVRAIGYKLYVQKHLESALLEAVTACFARRPQADRLLSRIAYAAREWPDFEVPETLPPELARLLRPM